MTVKFLAKMLVPETEVIIKDKENEKVYFIGTAGEIVNNNFIDTVRDWNFENGHEFYI